MNIAHILLDQARLRPNAAAIITTRNGRDQVMTFAELADASARVADQLLKAGLVPGDNVLLLVPMSPELYAILTGLFRAGLVPTVLDPSAGRAHIDRCCELSPPAGFIGIIKAHLLRLISSSIRRIPRKFCVDTVWPVAQRIDLVSGNKSERIADLSDDAPALLTFTSGSTGQPKAVVRSHAFLVAQHRALERSIQLVPGQVDLATLPVFVLANLGSGVTTVIPDCDPRYPGRIDPGPVLEQISRLEVTRTAGSPALIERLMEASESKKAGATLRHVYTGGAPVFPSLLRALKSTWLDCEPVAVYGSTEAEPIAHIALNEISPEDFAAMGSGRGLLAGHPVTEIDLAIIANQWGKPIGPFTKAGFSKEQLPAGTAGEIVVAGDHVLRGYLGGRGDAETKFRVDDRIWHRTGDVGYLDAAGRLWLVGRCSARMVDSLGELHPFSVECVARQFDWVRLAGCVAVNGIRCLAVEPRTPPSAEDELKLLQAVSWAHIQQIHLVNPMPVDRRHNAKIDYAALVQRISQPGSTLCLK